MWWSSLPKIEECGPRPSLSRTNDWTRGPLGVFVRQIKSVPAPKSFQHSDIDTSDSALFIQIFALFVNPFSMFAV